MAFNLDAVKGQYFDAEVAVNKILEDERFEDELQAMLEEAVQTGYKTPRLYLRVIHTDRANNTIEIGSTSPMVFSTRTISKNLHNDKIKKMDKAALAIKEKLESLKLKVEYRPNPTMGEDWGFEECAEHQEYEATFIIYLDFD